MISGTEWAAIITALFFGVGTLVAAIVTAGLQIASFVRQGRAVAIATETHEIVVKVAKQTDGLASAAAEVSRVAADRAMSERDKDRASAERTVNAALASRGAPADAAPAPLAALADGGATVIVTAPGQPDIIAPVVGITPTTGKP